MNALPKWETEPEKEDFEAHGFKCAIRRNGGGAWCGYVGVDSKHSWFEKGYDETVEVPKNVAERPIDVDKIGAINLFCAAAKCDDIKEGRLDIVLAVDVHGGLTYASKGSHIEYDSKLWWFGFDCSHSGDLNPKWDKMFPSDDDVYRDHKYVKSECESLAKQLASFK